MTPFFMAWSMFLWIPCPSKKWDDGKKQQMLLCLPLIGIIIGFLWAGITCLLGFAHYSFIPSAVACIVPWLLTGFMHLDGYMDCADAVLSFKNQDKKLEILKDTHVGSFAVIAMVILGVLQFATFLQGIPFLALFFLPVMSRALSVLFILASKPLPTSSYVGLVEGKVKAGYYVFLALLFVFCAVGLTLFCSFATMVAAFIGLLVELLIILYLRHNLGGMSGDISGAAITAGELAMLMAISLV